MCWARTRVLQSYQSRHYQPEKLAFYQLNYSRSAGTSNYSKEVLCAPSQNWPAWESHIRRPAFGVLIPKTIHERI